MMKTIVDTIVWMAEEREAVEQGIYDNYCDISESAIALLTKPARDWVCKIIEECWEWRE